MSEETVDRLARVGVVLGLIALLILTFLPDADAEEKPRANVAGPLAAYTVLGGADFAVTQWGLAHDGIREGNPVLQTHARQIAGQAAFAAGATWVDVKLQRRKSRARWPFRVLVFTVKAGAVAWNVRNVRRAQAERGRAR